MVKMSVCRSVDYLGVTANYERSTGILNITGSATLAQYETLLGRVIYNNIDPNPDLSDRTVQFVLNDGELDSNITTSILEFNRPPIGINDGTFFTNNRDPFIIDVLANDSDPDGDPLTITSITGVGTNEVTTDGTLIEYIRIGTRGFGQFTYTVSDSRGGIDTAQVGVACSTIFLVTILKISQEKSLAITSMVWVEMTL